MTEAFAFDPRAERLGNEFTSASKYADFSTPPWMKWPESSRSARCIRFIEEYVHIPSGHGAGQLLKLHPFQRRVVEEILEDSASVSAWQVCRGNAKSTLIAAMGLWALCDYADAPQVPLVAHDGKHAERTLFAPLQRMVNASPALKFPRLKIYTAAGDKRIHSWWNDGDILPLPADVDRLQGLIPTVAIIDEAQTVPFDVFWTLRQGAGKRPVSITILIGTPDRDLGNALYRWRRMHREGGSGRYLEHAADVDCPLDDRAQWVKANPALAAGFLREDVIASEAADALLDADAEVAFRMYRLGQWPDGEAPLDSFGRAVRACEDPDATATGQFTFAVDVGPAEGAEAWIVAVGDGIVEVVDHKPGTAWLPHRLDELISVHGGEVALDATGPIAARLQDLQRRVPIVNEGRGFTATEVMAAAARFVEDVTAYMPRIRPSTALRQAVAGAQRFGTGDSWRWARRRSPTADIAPLVAVSLGWWQYVNGAVPEVH